MPMVARIFMVIWLAMTTLFSVAFLAGDLRSPNGTPASLPLFELLFPAAGIGLIVLGKWFARNDVPWLSDVITRALTTPGDTTPQNLPADLPGASEVLKLVAVFLAVAAIVSGVVFINTPQLLPPGTQAMYVAFAILDLVLAIGVWFRRPWAWWGGFIVLAATMFSPLVTLPTAMRQLPLLFQAAFAVCLLLVVGSWGAWWYGKRTLFLWNTTANSNTPARPDGS